MLENSKNRKESAVKRSIEKPILFLLILLILFTISWPRLFDETHFHFLLGLDFLNLILLPILVF